MTLSNREIAAVIFTAIRQHEDLYRGLNDPMPGWWDTHYATQQIWEKRVERIRKLSPMDGPAAAWAAIRADEARQQPYAMDYHKEFDDLPVRVQEQVFLTRSIVTALTGWVEPYKAAMKGCQARP